MSGAVPQTRAGTSPVNADARGGSVMPYLMHLRPMAWPIVALHAATGWWIASGLRVPDGQALLGIGAWVVCLNGGSLALNSVYDRDDGDIAWLRRPPAPPAALPVVAILLLVSGFVATWSLPIAYRATYAACAALSLIASMPPLHLNRVPGAGWFITSLGYGAATLFAGWAISGRAITAPLIAILFASLALFVGFYPLTQLYQRDDDRERGEESLAVLLGVPYALSVAMIQAVVAFTVLACAGVLSRWEFAVDWARWSALLVAAGAWFVVLWPWAREGRGWSTAEQRRGMYHAVAAWALTDAALFVAWVL